MTVADVCRVSVRSLSSSMEADLALPNRVELGEVLPCVVDLLGERPEGTARWTVSRVDGSKLDESMTLDENGVRDGDVLYLGIEDRTLEVGFADVCRYVEAAAHSREDGDERPRLLGAIAFVWTTGVAATALVWPADSPVTLRAVVAIVLAVAAAIAAGVTSRVGAQPLPTLTLGPAAAVFASAAGFLLVPGGPAPPKFFLAATVCAAVSTVLFHITSGGTTMFVAIAALSTMSAIAAAVGTVWPAPLATIGAVLAAASLAFLGAAARITVLLTGLTPRTHSVGDDDESAAVGVGRAEHAHRVLTGLVAGLALATACGAVLVAAGNREQTAIRCAGFCGIVSVALVVRVGQQIGVLRSVAVLVAGLISATATFIQVVVAVPRYGAWLCLITVALGAAALVAAGSGVSLRLSPFARRSAEVVEYLALAAVVPLACWVANLFGFVRGWSLS